jgi:hypothetical protein
MNRGPEMWCCKRPSKKYTPVGDMEVYAYCVLRTRARLLKHVHLVSRSIEITDKI